MARCPVRPDAVADDGPPGGGEIRRIPLSGREKDGSSMPSFSCPENSEFRRNPAATSTKRRTHPSRVHPHAAARQSSHAPAASRRANLVLAPQHGGRGPPHAAKPRTPPHRDTALRCPVKPGMTAGGSLPGMTVDGDWPEMTPGGNSPGMTAGGNLPGVTADNNIGRRPVTIES